MAKVTADERLCKQPDEKRQFSMDFSSLMTTAETIEASSPAPTVTSTTTASDAVALTIETIAVSGQTITVWLSGGTHCASYRIEFKITTSTAAILVGDGILDVRNK